MLVVAMEWTVGLPARLTPPPAAWPDRTPACRGHCGPPSPLRGTAVGHDPGARLMTAHRHPDTLPWVARPGSRTPGTRPSSLGPPGRELFRRSDRRQTLHTPVPHSPPADGALDAGTRLELQPAVGLPDAGGAPVARTPAADPGDEGPAQDASGPPPPVEAHRKAPRPGPTARPDHGPTRRGQWRRTPTHCRGPHRWILREACPQGRASWRWIRPRLKPRMDRTHNQAAHDHSLGHPPLPTRLACDTVHATMRATRGGLPDRVELFAVAHPPPPLSPPVGWLGPTRRMAAGDHRRVCLAFHELSAVGARCRGPRCSSAVLAALAGGNSANLPAVRAAPPGLGHPPAAG